MRFYNIATDDWIDDRDFLIMINKFNSEQERAEFLQKLGPQLAQDLYLSHDPTANTPDAEELEDSIAEIPFPVVIMFRKGPAK